MGRNSHRRALSVWSNGQRVGTWRLPTRADAELHYDPQWVQSLAGRPLSLSLPFTIGNAPLKGARVLNFFDNLLPDSEPIRNRLAGKFKTGSTEAFALLQAIGRDCVGAIQLLPENEQPIDYDTISGTPLSDAEVEEYLRRAVAPGAGLGQQDADEDDFRISLAGAHEKTALLWHNKQWMRPHGATPTTHIFKLPLGKVGRDGRIDMSTSVENEWLCSRILQAYGLPVAQSHICDFGAQRVLVVERFDRRLHSSGTWWMRLPQEDFCQVLGVAPYKKYESEGGPGVVDVCKVLQQSTNAGSDLQTFMSAMVLFWMLAATDGHAKNFSLQILQKGRYRMTPLYDVLSMWPVEGGAAHQMSQHKAKLAMAISGKNRHYHLKEILRRHFNAMASRCGIGTDMEPIIQGIINNTPAAIAQVIAQLPAGFPSSIAEPILGQLQESAKRLAEMPAR